MSSVTINPHVFQCQEDNLMHLAAVLKAVSDRVQKLNDLVETCCEEVREQMDKETDELWSVLRCLSVVADATGGRVAEWRALAAGKGIAITSQLE